MVRRDRERFPLRPKVPELRPYGRHRTARGRCGSLHFESYMPSQAVRSPPACHRVVKRVRYLQHSSNLFTGSHCGAGFLLWCNEATTDGGRNWLATSLMSPSTGAPAQKKRAFSQMKWMIRNLKTRCCESLRITNTLLRGPKTGPWGVYQTLEPKHQRPREAIHEHRDGSVDRDSDIRVWYYAGPVEYATKPLSTLTCGVGATRCPRFATQQGRRALATAGLRQRS